jgi:hypothetical protein
VTARHDGYRRLARPVYVQRTVVGLADSAWLVIDALEGEGSHAWESFIHAVPEAKLELEGEGRAQLTRSDQRLAIAWFGLSHASIARGDETPHQGWYAPEFGLRVPRRVLVLGQQGTLPACCGYVIVPDRAASQVDVGIEPDGVRIKIGSTRFLVEHSASEMRARRLS